MNDYYVEVLVKRNVEKEKQKRKIIMLAMMTILLVLGIATKSQLLFCLFVLSIFGYYFLVRNYCVEFEYFYMDGELTITKILNKSKRKKILELNDGQIKLIAPVESADLQNFHNLKKFDCSENKPLDFPYVMICEHKGELNAVNIQMTDELYKELKKNMPHKVKKY